MAYCMNCGQEATDGAKFCSNCGTSIGKVGKEMDQRKTTYDGEIHKCPNCGEVLNSFVSNCPFCGYEIRTLNTNGSVKELVTKIEKASSLAEKIELITNFYIPNTKEDIYEFLILAVSNLEDTNYETDDAWQAKLEQAYHKAKLLFGKTSEFEYVDELYKKTITKVAKARKLKFVRKNKKLCLSIILVCVGMLMLIIGIIINSSVSIEENWGASYSGTLLLILGLNLLCGPIWIYSIAKANEDKKNGLISVSKESISTAGKETMDSLRKTYDEVIKEFKSMGSKK